MEYWNDYQRDILAIVDDSFLCGYDDWDAGVAFRSAATVSIAYSLMSRCGLAPENHFEHEDFLNIFDFNTPEAAAELGTAVSRISGQVLREIEVTIKNYEREKRAKIFAPFDALDGYSDAVKSKDAAYVDKVDLNEDGLAEEERAELARRLEIRRALTRRSGVR